MNREEKKYRAGLAKIKSLGTKNRKEMMEYIAGEGYQKLQGYKADLSALQNEFEEVLSKNNTGDREDKITLFRKRTSLYRSILDRYEAMTALMSNEYYGYIPLEELDKLSYEELRKRLNDLYDRPDRDGELIGYFEAALRLRINESEMGGDLSLPWESCIYSPSIATAEKKKEKKSGSSTNGKQLETELIAGAYEALHAYIEDKELFELEADLPSPEELHEADLLRISIPKTQSDASKESGIKYRGSDGTGIVLTEEQEEEIIMIGTALLRETRTGGKSEKYRSFAINLAAASPEQQLLTYYQAEKGITGSGIDFVSVLHGYKPDCDAFIERLDWNNLSAALRTSIAYQQDMEKYVRLYSEIEESESADPAVVGKDKKRKQGSREPFTSESIKTNIGKRLSLIGMLYRSSGMHPDTPIDLKEDSFIRKRLIHECENIRLLLENYQNNDSEATAGKMVSDIGGLSGISLATLTGFIESVISLNRAENTTAQADKSVRGLSAIGTLSAVGDGLAGVAGISQDFSGSTQIYREARNLKIARNARDLLPGDKLGNEEKKETAGRGFLLSGAPASKEAIPGVTDIDGTPAQLGVQYTAREKSKLSAVDEYLCLEDLLNTLNTDARPEKLSDDELREKVRTQALARLGFSSPMVCFRHIAYLFAEDLRRKAFERDVEGNPSGESRTYLDTLKSLGLNTSDPKIPLVKGEDYKPSAEAVTTKLMS